MSASTKQEENQIKFRAFQHNVDPINGYALFKARLQK